MATFSSPFVKDPHSFELQPAEQLLSVLHTRYELIFMHLINPLLLKFSLFVGLKILVNIHGMWVDDDLCLVCALAHSSVCGWERGIHCLILVAIHQESEMHDWGTKKAVSRKGEERRNGLLIALWQTLAFNINVLCALLVIEFISSLSSFLVQTYHALPFRVYLLSIQM